MNNLLPKSIRGSEKYDLKGSTYKRKASKHEIAKSSPTFKDLDFKDRHTDGILLEADTYDALMKTVKRDCRVRVLTLGKINTEIVQFCWMIQYNQINTNIKQRFQQNDLIFIIEVASSLLHFKFYLGKTIPLINSFVLCFAPSTLKTIFILLY